MRLPVVAREVGAPDPDLDLDLAVVVPARDEAGRIGPLLASLAGQVPPPREVVVVDDGSTDATAQMARAAGLRVVDAPPRPRGWNPKQWSCHTGESATTAPVLCFVDADVTLSPGALAAVVAAVDRHGGLVSVQPRHDTASLVEGLSLVPNLVSMMGTDGFGPLRGRVPPSGAFGPVLACRRADHERAGGHEGVRAALMEDVALAGAYRRAGLPVTLFTGGDAVRFRMHRGLADLADGWVRGLADGARNVRVLTLAAIALWVSGLVSAPLLALQRPAAGACLSAAYAVQLGLLGRRIGRFPVMAWLLFPLGAATFVWLFLRSAAILLGRRTVRWKGRDLPT